MGWMRVGAFGQAVDVLGSSVDVPCCLVDQIYLDACETFV